MLIIATCFFQSVTRASKAATASAAVKPAVSVVTTKSSSAQQTVTLVQKQPTVVTTGPPHKIVTVNRPLIKVTSGPPGW
jgi:hypothetical protein